MPQSINLEKIILNSFLNNKILLLSLGALFAGYWFQDVMFSRNFGKVLADIPKFVDEMSFSKVLAIIFPYVIAHFLFYIDDIIQAKRLPKMELSIINELLHKIFDSIKTTKKQVNVNELVMNLKNVLDIKNIYILITIYIVPTLLVGGAVLYYFFSADIKYGLIAVGMLAFFILLSLIFEKDCIDASKEHEETVCDLYDEIQDLMINNDTVLTFNTKEEEMKHMKEITDKCVDKHTICEMKTSEVTFKLNSLSMIMMIALDALVIKMYIDKIIGADMLIAICMMTYTFIQYYNSSIFKIKSVIHYIGKYQEIKNYFSTFEIEDQKQEDFMEVSKGKIVFNNVQVIHDEKVMPLKLNFEVEGGSKTAIVGEIGTGKTSILKILAGLKKYKGDVYIDGQNIKGASHDSLVESIIYIPQHPKLFNRTIYENLAYGTNLNQKQVEAVIKEYGIEKFFKKFPQGIMTNVGKEGNKLSGGQKQIVALIRAIIQQKKIILLDEPTSSLDTETKGIFMNLIEAMKGSTILVVTHDKTIDNIFDEHIELE